MAFWGLGSRNQGFRIEGLGFRIQGLGDFSGVLRFRV